MFDTPPPAYLDEAPPPAGPGDFGLPDWDVWAPQPVEPAARRRGSGLAGGQLTTSAAYTDFGADRLSDPPLLRSGGGKVETITPTPFTWRDPTTLPPREWVYGRRLVRRYVAVTVAPGGTGKSTLVTLDALAMASGRRLLHEAPHSPLTVWLWNGEDPRDELERRVAATALGHRLDPDEFAGRLYLDSGRDVPIRIAEMSGGAIKLARPTVDAVEKAIRDRGIDVMVLDPFISTHSVPENSNGEIDRVVKEWAGIAHRTGIAIELVHHVRKLNGTEADADSARGAGSFIAAARSGRALNVMSSEVAKGFDITDDERKSFVRIDDVKANLAPPSAARWMRLFGQPLGNRTEDRDEDWVAVAAAWTPPDSMEGLPNDALDQVKRAMGCNAYRKDSQSLDWLGHVVGRVLGFDAAEEPGRTQAKNLIRAWMKSGALAEVEMTDRKGNPRPGIAAADRGY